MSESKHLRLVDDEAKPARPADEQLSFSFAGSAHTMFLANLVNASEAEFLGALKDAEPDLVVDLRVVPRFDFGRLSRKVVFRIFESMSARYCDLPNDIGVTARGDASLNPVFLVDPLARILENANRVLILLDDAGVLEVSARILPDRIHPQPKGGWGVRRLREA